MSSTYSLASAASRSDWSGLGSRRSHFARSNLSAGEWLAKQWPHVPCYEDVRTLTADQLRADGIAVDVICGGFPCQDISIAQGRSRAGLDGERSGLWSEYARIIGDIRPRYIIVENVPGLVSLGLGRVLGELAALGYDAEWFCIPAGTVGAPHIRDRWWLVGYPNRDGQSAFAVDDEVAGMPRMAPDAGCEHGDRREAVCAGDGDAYRTRFANWQEAIGSAECGRKGVAANANGGNGHWRKCDVQMGRRTVSSEIADAGFRGGAEWGAEPDVGRVAHGVPARVDRLRGLGNAVVPQIPEIIGRAIMSAEGNGREKLEPR